MVVQITKNQCEKIKGPWAHVLFFYCKAKDFFSLYLKSERLKYP